METNMDRFRPQSWIGTLGDATAGEPPHQPASDLLTHPLRVPGLFPFSPAETLLQREKSEEEDDDEEEDDEEDEPNEDEETSDGYSE
jgi:hypothetical protein